MCGPMQYTTCHMAGEPEKHPNKPKGKPQAKKGPGRGGRGSKGVKGGGKR